MHDHLQNVIKGDVIFQLNKIKKRAIKTVFPVMNLKIELINLNLVMKKSIVEFLEFLFDIKIF